MSFDLAVIGGGVNGCGIARDAAGRGLKVVLIEQGDLAQATSSASTKLFHGGLRYLEYYEFRLVREALVERETLLVAMPHIARPLRFVLPHHAGLRPAWLLRLGLFIYDHLGGREILPATRSLDLGADPAGAPLKPGYVKGFEYSDCWVDDARLVVLNARDAAARGAEIRTRIRFEHAEPVAGGWRLHLADGGEVRAKAVVNAGGPWVGSLIREGFGRESAARVRLVRGSHIVTRRLFEHDRAYIFQQADGRVVFAIPYEEDFTLIGTTDMEHEGAPGEARCTQEERDYLLAAAREYFRAPVEVADIVWSYSGVRPLYDDGASSATAATRDYVINLRHEEGAAAVDVFGGKITTYRRLSEAVLAKLAADLPGMGGPWTARVPLPGGGFGVGEGGALARELAAGFPFLDAAWAGAAGQGLRHRGAGDAGRCAHGCGHGRAVRLEPDRARGALADGARVGADRRGRALAPDEARAPARRRRGGAARGMDGPGARSELRARRGLTGPRRYVRRDRFRRSHGH